MIEIDKLSIGTDIIYTDTDYKESIGKIIGIYYNNSLTGEVDQSTIDHFPSGCIKIKFPTFNNPPETVSVSCSNDVLSLLNPPKDKLNLWFSRDIAYLNLKKDHELILEDIENIISDIICIASNSFNINPQVTKVFFYFYYIRGLKNCMF